MVTATKEEAAYLREHIKGVCIYRTMKFKNRGVYYIEETKAVLDLLSNYRKNLVIAEEYPASE